MISLTMNVPGYSRAERLLLPSAAEPETNAAPDSGAWGQWLFPSQVLEATWSHSMYYTLKFFKVFRDYFDAWF